MGGEAPKIRNKPPSPCTGRGWGGVVPYSLPTFLTYGGSLNKALRKRYEQRWRELEVADATGFDYCFAVEHHVDPHGSLSCSPPLYIAAAAARTQHMRVGAIGWTVPLYDPLRVVEEVVSLDHLTRGRLEVGPVSGARPQHFGLFNQGSTR